MTERPEYHITGMGWYGCLTAWTLWRGGKTFSWSDTEEHHRAWEASSGLVYPVGGEDAVSYRIWRYHWMQGEAPWSSADRPNKWTESGAFWFASKSLPNGAKGKIVADVGPIRLSDQESIHVNVAQFVLDTRQTFAANRTDGRVWGQREIIAHGYTPERLHHYVWGWTAHAQLDIDHSILEASEPCRPCFYLRVGRYQFAYANPLPGTNLYVVGSAHIAQQPSKQHDLPRSKVWDKVDTWMRFVKETTHWMVSPHNVSDPIQGWRPAGGPDAWRHQIYPKRDGTLLFPPMGGDGIRLAPKVQANLMERLGLYEGMEVSRA